MREREYRWYLTGCNRLGQSPLSEAEFAARWQEYEDYAEQLKAAEAEGTEAQMDAAHRAEMQRRFKEDPFVKATLIGMSEDQA
jgi:hypothetical protein